MSTSQTEPKLVQVNSHRGFAFKINPMDAGEMPTVTVVNILTGKTIGTAVGQLAAGALVDEALRA